MECCIFIVFIIIMIASGALSGKKTSSSGGGNESVNLDDIFNEVMKVSNQKSSSSSNIGMNNSMGALPPAQPLPQPSRRRNNRQAPSQPSPRVSRQSLVTPTSHGNHNCDEVNYDHLGSLEGGTGSFNLGGEPEHVVSYAQQNQIKIGREDLLKSFIMSEVLQRYDINRIYSRIPPIKNDD